MSFQSVVLEQLASINTRLNAIVANAKRIFELPEQTTLAPSSKIHVDNATTSEYVTIQQIIDASTPSTTQVTKEELIPDTQGQKTFLVPGNPENIEVTRGRTPLIENSLLVIYDYSYDPITGILVTTEGVDLLQRLFVTGFSNQTSTKQQIIATIENQTEFFFSGAPNNINVTAGRSPQIETIDYVRTRFSVDNKIDLTEGVASGTIITIRKF